MATYKEIIEEVQQEYGISVKTCWIAHVKEQNGIPMRKAPNRISTNIRKHPCPESIKAKIETAMIKLGAL